MVVTLKVIALVSGGKDSLFSILHCQANGHQVVALANLFPPPTSTGEGGTDSYMYQTVGHSVIPLYEQALGIPVFRQAILGQAIDANRDYTVPSSMQERDETEDLIPLLSRVLAAFPEANAVSTGAILSTYQRTRVESVALRLGLTPLSYLWQYPLLPPYTQSSLLRDMARVSLKALIIKTASGGLDERFLGLDVAAPTTIASLCRAMSRYGEADYGAILGEGGEFETLTIDGPSHFWEKRISLDVGPPDVLDGGQTVLTIRTSTLEEKSKDTGLSESLRIPEIMDDEFKAVLEAIQPVTHTRSFVSNDDATPVKALPVPAVAVTDCLATFLSLPLDVTNDTSTTFTCSNLTSDSFPNTSSGSPSRQMVKILLRLEHILKQRHLSRTSINHTTLLLRDMSHFAAINCVYGRYFNQVNPPARVTLALENTMPEHVDVMLSVILDKEDKGATANAAPKLGRQGLHVQGRSYWAPANIGPYSQAISVPLPQSGIQEAGQEALDAGDVVYVAGQIPLVPASMELYNEHDFAGQATLSLQHLWRIGRTKGVKWWTMGLALLPTCEHADEHVRIVQETWTTIHTRPLLSSSTSTTCSDEEDPSYAQVETEIDPWDRLNRNFTPTFHDKIDRAPIPDHTAISCSTGHESSRPIPPCFVAQVSSLPRGADVEWTALGLTAPSIIFTRPLAHAPLTISTPSRSRSRFYTLEITNDGDVDLLRCQWGETSFARMSHATLYAGLGLQSGSGIDWRGVQWVPCLRVWGESGKEVRGVLMGRVDEGGTVPTAGDFVGSEDQAGASKTCVSHQKRKRDQPRKEK